MNTKNNKCYGFTLLEMSLTILVIGILLVTGISFQLSLVENSSKNLTLNKLNRIQQAIDEYILNNGGLPCPAHLLFSNDNLEYGKELRDSSGCFVKDNDFYNSSEKIIYGAVPTKTLGLTNDFSLDNWKNQIIYIVKENYSTKQGLLNGSEKGLTIKNRNNDVITNNAIYVLFTSGENKNGAFRKGKQIGIDNNLEDIENIFVKNFDKVFIKDITDDYFDDILYYREKNEILLNLGFEDALCNLNDLTNLDNDWNYLSYLECPNNLCQHGVEIVSKDSCKENYFSKNSNINPIDNLYKPIRKCLKYGKWSDVMYTCTAGCGISNIFTLNKGDFYKQGEPQSSISINLDYLKKVAINETAVFECMGDKVGFVKLKCIQNGDIEQGEWEYIAGDCINKDKIKNY